MRNRRKQKIIIGTLVAIIVGMVVGYAALSQLLNINGTSSIEGSFDIQITNIAENTMTGAKTVTTGGIGTTTANFTVDLTKPGSSAVYDVTVENKGTINAVLKSIEGLNEANAASPTDIKFEVSGINVNDDLNVGVSKTFQVKVTWLGTSTSIPETNKTLSLKLNYEQGGSSGGTPTISGPANEALIANVLKADVPAGESGLVAIDNTGEVTTSTTPREYRYIGPNPDNYVSFNNELWRIIGIFDGQLKIIRTNKLDTSAAWNSSASAGPDLRSGAPEITGTGGISDWTQATLKTYLNGEYLNSIDSTSRNYISDYKWRLGGSNTEDITAQTFYESERGTDNFSGTTEWTGKIALMYPSDYGFATSGGSTTNRSSCLANSLYKWKDSSVSDCKNNSWLYESSSIQWTLTPTIDDVDMVYIVFSNGIVDYVHTNSQNDVRPTLYLKSWIRIISGTGTNTDPFILDLVE